MSQWLIYSGPSSHAHRVAHLPRRTQPTGRFSTGYISVDCGARIIPTFYDELPGYVEGKPVRPCAVCVKKRDTQARPRSRSHRYVSTACFHATHDQCRQVCKFCDAHCRCGCHVERAA